MRYINLVLITLSLIATFSFSSLPIASAASCPAGSTQSQCDACNGLGQLGGTSCSSTPSTSSQGQNQIAATAKTVVNIISFIAGIIVVILIVVAGVRLVASGGDSQAAAGARNMLIYAIVGIAIVALSQAIVHFVLDAILNHNVAQNAPTP